MLNIILIAILFVNPSENGLDFFAIAVYLPLGLLGIFLPGFLSYSPGILLTSFPSLPHSIDLCLLTGIKIRIF